MSLYARAAPAVFPMPFHRTLDVVDREQAIAEARGKGRENRKDSLFVPPICASQNTGQKGAINTDPALTINAITERAAMALIMPNAGELQCDSGGAQ